MIQNIAGFHQDEENHWVARLECGHAQHMRHDPPWMERPWVITKEGRESRIGTELNCKRCDEIIEQVTTTIHTEAKKTLQEAYTSAGISGLCTEGRWEVALDSLNKTSLRSMIEKALEALKPKEIK